MRAFGLVLLLVCSALSAPQGEVAEAKKPKARQVTFGQEPVFVQSAPQFGAKIVPENAQVVYLQGGYQQPQYYTSGQQPQYFTSGQQPQYYTSGQQPQYFTSGQQYAYISGSPAQSYVSGAPAYYTSTASAQPVVSVKKTFVKPAAYQQVAAAPQVSFKAQSAPVVVSTYKAPVQQVTYKAPAPVVKVAAPAPAPVVRVSSAVNQYHAEPFHAIVKESHDDNFDGSFTYSYETDHGVAVQSSGFLKNAGTDAEAQVIQGSYTYYSPEGLPITTYYLADENGFQVQGDHLPVAPPLPDAIAKSLEYQRSLPPSAEDQKSQ